MISALKVGDGPGMWLPPGMVQSSVAPPAGQPANCVAVDSSPSMLPSRSSGVGRSMASPVHSL